MFTGIIQSIGKLKQEKNILEIEILDNLFDMAIGDSIAVDEICLTVKEIFQNKFNLQGKGCLGEKMKRQIIINKKFCTQHKINNIIFIGTDLPDLCHQDLLNTLRDFQQNDLILGPSNDGGYWLIGLSEKIMSSHIYLPFINIKWGTKNVLQNTIDNFASTKFKYKFLDKKIDIDTIIDIENRK